MANELGAVRNGIGMAHSKNNGHTLRTERVGPPFREVSYITGRMGAMTMAWGTKCLRVDEVHAHTHPHACVQLPAATPTSCPAPCGGLYSLHGSERASVRER
jgi:hypothetical protein